MCLGQRCSIIKVGSGTIKSRSNGAMGLWINTARACISQLTHNGMRRGFLVGLRAPFLILAAALGGMFCIYSKQASRWPASILPTVPSRPATCGVRACPTRECFGGRFCRRQSPWVRAFSDRFAVWQQYWDRWNPCGYAEPAQEYSPSSLRQRPRAGDVIGCDADIKPDASRLSRKQYCRRFAERPDFNAT